MERKLIISARPNCRICGKPLESWNPYAYTHEHPECTAEQVSDALMKIVRQSFDDTRRALAASETLARYGKL